SYDNVPIGYDRFCRQGAQKTETRRQLPDASTTSLQDVADLGYAACRVVVDLEVPESQRYPTRIFELSINPTVSLLVGRDLAIPKFSRLSWRECRGVSVPERSVHEDRDLGAKPGDVRRPWDVSPMKAVSPDARVPKGLTKHQL